MNRDNSRLDMRLLQAFVALIEERNVTRASERLHLTQQGLSGQLARMRELFGDPLFVRVKAGVEPTPRALVLEPMVRAAVAQLTGLMAPDRFDPRSFSGTATIAAADFAMALILPPLLGVVLEQAPGLRIQTRHADAATMGDILDARVDMAITVPQFTSPGLSSVHLFKERYVGVARQGHPLLSGSPDITLDAFCEQTHLLVSPFRGDAAGPTDDALAAVGRRRKIGLVVPGFSVVGALLEQTDLIAVMPERLIRAMRRRLVTFRPPVSIQGFDLNIYWSPRLDQDLMHSWLREAISEAARKVAE